MTPRETRKSARIAHNSCFAYWPKYAAGIYRRCIFTCGCQVRECESAVAGAVYHGGIAGIAGTTNRRSPNLLLVIDRLFIQMNADYRGGFSMLRQLAGAMNKLLPGARTPVLSVVLLQGPLSPSRPPSLFFSIISSLHRPNINSPPQTNP